MPRVACKAYGKTTQVAVPWARAGAGFTAAFKALALALFCRLPVRQVATLLRCEDKQLWQRIEHYAGVAREKEELTGITPIGIDETSLHRGRSYITVAHNLATKHLLFATEGRDHQTVPDFVRDLRAHGGRPEEMCHMCMDMSGAYAKGGNNAFINNTAAGNQA